MNRLQLILITFLLGIAVTGTQAMTIYHSNGTIVMSGKVIKADLQKFKTLSAKYPKAKEVRLNSPGGHLITGIKLGLEIRKKGMNTYINNKSYCASACTKIFLGGKKRVIQKGGNLKRLGFHASGNTYDGDDTLRHIFENGQYAYSITAWYYSRMLSDVQKLRKLLKFHMNVLKRKDALVVVWPKLTELARIGYITHTRG